MLKFEAPLKTHLDYLAGLWLWTGAFRKRRVHLLPSIADTTVNSHKIYSAAFDAATSSNDSSELSSWSIAISSSTFSPAGAADSIGRYYCCHSRC